MVFIMNLCIITTVYLATYIDTPPVKHERSGLSWRKLSEGDNFTEKVQGVT